MFTFIAMIVVAAMFFRSPLPGAIAARLRGEVGGGDRALSETVRQLQEDVRMLHEELTDVVERQDFTERVLTEVRRSRGLGPQ